MVPSPQEQERICQFTQTHLADPGIGVSQDVVHVICEKNLVCNIADEDRDSDRTITLVQSLATSPEASPDSFVNEDQYGGLPVIPHLSEKDIRDKQQADLCLREVVDQIESGEKLLPTARKELPDVPFLLRK